MASNIYDPCLTPDYPGVAAHVIHLLVSFKAWNELVLKVFWENLAAHLGHPWFFFGILADLVGIVQNVSGANRTNVYFFDLMNIFSMAYAIIGMPFFAGLYHVSVNIENRHLIRLGYAIALLITFMPLVLYRRKKRLRMFSMSRFAVLLSLFMMAIQAIRYKDFFTFLGILVMYYAVEKVGNGNKRWGPFTAYHYLMILIAVANICFVLGFSVDNNWREVVGEENIKIAKKKFEDGVNAAVSALPDLKAIFGTTKKSSDDDMFGDYEFGKGKGGKGKGKRAGKAAGKGKMAGKGKFAGKGTAPQAAGVPPARGKGVGPGGRPPAGKGVPMGGKGPNKGGPAPAPAQAVAASLMDNKGNSRWFGFASTTAAKVPQQAVPQDWIKRRRAHRFNN
jgi:hypothetical protein